MGETDFLMYLTPDDRVRHHHRSVKGEIVEFAIQYEARILESWHPIIRYDTAHGFSHQDRMHADGSVNKIALPYWDYSEALSFAQHDVRLNWESYRLRYEKEMGL